MNLKNRLIDLSGAALIAAMLGSSMSLSVLDSLALSFSAWQVVLINTAVSLLCAAMLLGKIPALIATLGVACGISVPLIRNINIFAALKETLVSLLTIMIGGEGSLNEHAAVLLFAISILFALIAFLMSRLAGGVYPTMLLFAFVTMGSWYLEERLILAYTVPGLIALAVLYAREHREGMNYLKALPIALAAALLAVLLMPAGNPTWQPLADAAEKVRELFSDYFLFTDPRTVYSVSSDGYQPLGETLGGPANPRQADVMMVKTDRILLLRGSVRRTYTGHSWVDNSMNSRYLFVDPTRQSLRDGVFDVDLSPALNGGLTEVTADVKMLNEGTSTLFVPHRLRSLTMPIDLVAYYNDSGEVFITRGVQYGDAYTFKAFLPDADTEKMSAIVNSAANGSDPDYQNILNSYMNIPAGLDDDVYWLTRQIVEAYDTPYDKALAIQRHLLSGEYVYRLDVDYPPSGRDFVSHFLLDSKEGYCTYYASAMAVMARLAGLPSRYIEGYLVQADPSGETLVTGNNAHAWVEIYFEGVGWLPFDATPGDQQNEENQGGASGSEPEATPTAEPSPTPSPTPDRGDADGENEPENHETATPEPTSTPEPNGSDADEPTPTPDPQQNQTPEPTMEPDADSDDENDNSWLRTLLMILAILLLLLLLAMLLVRRYMMTEPGRLADRQKKAENKLMVWYRAVLTLLMRSGFVPEGGETPEQFAVRLVGANAAPEQLIELARAVERQQYARSGADNEALELAETVYGLLLNQMKPIDRVRWEMYRIMKGIGNFRQIP